MKSILLACIWAGAICAQTFEVASVKRSAPQTGTGKGFTGALPRQQEPGRIDYMHVHLKAVVAVAWNLEQDQIAGPQWLDDEMYDITATFPPEASAAELPTMLQHLLADRFHMAVHEETRPRTGLALVVAKGGAKLTRAGDKSHAGFVADADQVTFGKLTMAGFVRMLSLFTGRHVTDETGIEGEYDIPLKASFESMNSGTVSPPIQDLGLRLETRTAPAKFVVVDKADKVPTGN